MPFAKNVLFSLVLAVLVPGGAVTAQQSGPAPSGPCTEQFVKEQISTSHHSAVADDAYFFSGALEKPVIGRATADRAFKPVAAQRKNAKYAPLKAERIVAAASGEMAYEYGTSEVSFDEVGSGKHIAFTAAYLRVWRSIDGSCKEAAFMAEPEGEN
jgi:ketosteroid isomerase-like protein